MCLRNDVSFLCSLIVPLQETLTWACGVCTSQGSTGDGFHTILAAQGVCCSLLSGGIVLPHSVRNESVFVTAGFERHIQMPDAIGVFVHWHGLGVPIVEVAGQRHSPGCASRESELNRTVFIIQ